jgi:hydrogenase maturation protease
LRTLVIGFGNPGRRDDGLGPLLAESAAGWDLPGVEALSDYQLNIEHAADVAEADLVIFIDAAREGESPYSFYRAQPKAQAYFSTHALEPENVLETCREVYGKLTPAFVLAVRGETFEMGEGLSGSAEANASRAGSFLAGLLRQADPLARCVEASGAAG